MRTGVEIGSGNGLFLEYASKQLPCLSKCIGLDLSPDTIRKCKQRFDAEEFTWIATDAEKWVMKCAMPNTLFFSHRGVLEYFPANSLAALFGHISKNLRPALVVLIEPVSPTHDFATDISSRKYGREFSFSHNYPHLLHEAGYEIVHSNRIKLKGTANFIGVIALADL
ncbi:MAG: methyltransferase domain-containing protein [Chitinivibrionales bacterium]|nr:methyltransferase domain-containing protein [Chitinivibrionales bacterium]